MPVMTIVAALHVGVAAAGGSPFSNASWTADSNQYMAWLSAVASAGDVNGDGYDDVVVGAPFYDDGENDEGAAWVYHGGPTGLDVTDAWFAAPGKENSWFGFAVATAGDVNGDGFDDVVIGGPFHGTDEFYGGQAWLYHGSASGLTLDAVWTGDSDGGGLAGYGAAYGTSVASAGDVNGDGYDDVVVGAPYFEQPDAEGGRAFLYLGSQSGLGLAAAWAVSSDQYGAWFGQSVASAGDVNGDGFDDLVVGAPLFDGAEVDAGKLFVYLGSPTGPSALPDWSVEGDQAEAFLGYVVAAAGDVNGDGFDDVVTGAPYYDVGSQSDAGQAYVYAGSAVGLDVVPVWVHGPSESGDHYGISVAGAGDRDGDGFDDVVVGASLESSPELFEGVVRLYSGQPTGLTEFPRWNQQGESIALWFGSAVASAGDVDGDLLSDLLVASPAFGNLGEDFEGRAWLFEGACDEDPDEDGDGVGDACDLCPGSFDGDDHDDDGLPDGCDPCPLSADDTQFVDIDGDGAGAPCDCDPADPTTYPGAPQLCDGVDNTCSSLAVPDEHDRDADGARVCDGDCNDAEPRAYPGAPQVCDGVENTCEDTLPQDEQDRDFDGWVTCQGDCNDLDVLDVPSDLPPCVDGEDDACTPVAEAPDCDEDDEETAGCGCRASPGTQVGGIIGMLVLVLSVRRRRKDARKNVGGVHVWHLCDDCVSSPRAGAGRPGGIR